MTVGTLASVIETFASQGASVFAIAEQRSPVSPKLSPTEVARQTTVRIVTDSGMGSGVIIRRQGQVYTAITCRHVLADFWDRQITVLSMDGVIHLAQFQPFSTPANQTLDLDLALVTFHSERGYQVASLGDSDRMAANDLVYASGFPNYSFPNKNAIESTRNWGIRAYRLTEGKVAMQLDKSLPGGYRLGYSNEIEQGMSGGPVFNDRGQVIGINGRLKYPLQGIEVFTFSDGTKPSIALFRQMETLSWAIPVSSFQSAIAIH
ncbi:Trypsin-like peptidase domain-containing protein [Tumidithrix helvetica PCC 7403]|uniref:S1 family peptidase n=1 Tax=Tumidithrix helvetica TaxID=3457545 RepID=UPI003C9D0D07